jgi:hypothetical protein
MFEGFIRDIIGIVEFVFFETETVSAVMAAVIAIVAGLTLSAFAAVIGRTFLAVAFFGLAQVVVMWIERESLERAVTRGWRELLDLTVAEFLVYFIAFFLAISLTYMIRAAVRRG